MCFDAQVQYRHEVENFSLLRKIKKNPTFDGHESLMIQYLNINVYFHR